MPRGGSTFGICAGLFSNSGLGCVGAILVTVLTAGAILGLVAMAWWAR